MPHPGLIVIAEIVARTGDEDALLDALCTDKCATLANEASCKVFQVLVRDDHPGQFVLYEVYDDQAAFDRHRAAPYFAAFESAVKRFGAATPVIRLFNQVE